jgi:hypothetical protein
VELQADHPAVPAGRISRAYFSASIEEFLEVPSTQIIGRLTDASEFSVDLTQRDAWNDQIRLLKDSLPAFRGRGHLFFEFVVPRVGKRIDAVVVVDHVIFVIEFKVGESYFNRSAIDQVWDYALDLKNFHESSHALQIAPILIATGSVAQESLFRYGNHDDGVRAPLLISPDRLFSAMEAVVADSTGEQIAVGDWEAGRYKPTPTIVEAATALYGGHSVESIARSDAGATNLAKTSAAISRIIQGARDQGVKAICLVTGVPGAGKTLVGLDIATKYMDAKSDLHSVYLSGNGPLVAILSEALARDKVARTKAEGQKTTKAGARQAVKGFIQAVHHFRDECIKDPGPPVDRVAIFDEAQRAWNQEKTTDFMKRKKGLPNFNRSEPEFLVSCLDRHPDWAVVVCLIGGGQEINTGEAGIAEWIKAVTTTFPDRHIHVSPRLRDSEYAAGSALKAIEGHSNVQFNEDLHLSVSMRSFRAENLSAFVKKVLDLESGEAARLYREFGDRYPICITRDVHKARGWLKSKARGSERYGIVVSSQAQRLKPHAIDVKTPMDPVNWFLNPPDDVRSSFYLEDVATEFHVQGLELDWACVVWDGDFRYAPHGWRHHSFKGNSWQNINQPDRKIYLKNAYRVLLTRARQGMVIAVPHGDPEDPTRKAEFYDGTFEYLKGLGLPVI